MRVVVLVCVCVCVRMRIEMLFLSLRPCRKSSERTSSSKEPESKMRRTDFNNSIGGSLVHCHIVSWLTIRQTSIHIDAAARVFCRSLHLPRDATNACRSRAHRAGMRSTLRFATASLKAAASAEAASRRPHFQSSGARHRTAKAAAGQVGEARARIRKAARRACGPRVAPPPPESRRAGSMVHGRAEA